MAMIRLQKIIADSGICSRRKAELLIEQGEVELNGEIVGQHGVKADPNQDEIRVSGRSIKAKQKFVYFLFYKPRNIVSTLSDPQGRPTLTDFLDNIPERVYPVGRLDFQSEGLIILTNDGELTQKISHPSGLIRKTYHVQVNETLSSADVKKLKSGGIVEDKKVVPIAVSRIHPQESHDLQNDSWLEFILSEGRKREIRVLCEDAGLSVKRLIRVSIGRLELGYMRPGQLKPIDRSMLLSLLK